MNEVIFYFERFQEREWGRSYLSFVADCIDMSQERDESFFEDLYREYIGPVSESQSVFAGFGLFFTGVGLVVVSILAFLWSTAIPQGEVFKYVLRELAVATGASGIPIALLGVTVLLPVSRRIAAIGVVGVTTTLIATVRFIQVYPQAWYSNSSLTVGLYALGGVVVIATTGTALSSYQAERRGQRIAQRHLDRAEQAPTATDTTVTREAVERDIEEAMEGVELSWGGVKRDVNRDLTLRETELDGELRENMRNAGIKETEGGGVDSAVKGLKNLRGGEKKTASGSGTSAQTSALAELRATQKQEPVRETGLLARFVAWLRSIVR
ncbi:MAG: hypothetical protein U5K70_01820 [Halodesulfurarchaeum sp.]|nr:hypothetical protein [Halodesulfurarchaeum sp.]